MRVLIIDEDREAVEQLSEVVRELGHEMVGRASDVFGPTKGGVHNSHNKPEVIFLAVDCLAPKDINLIDLIKKANPQAKIVLTTKDPHKLNFAAGIGVSGVLRKPFPAEKLRLLLKHIETIFFSQPQAAQ